MIRYVHIVGIRELSSPRLDQSVSCLVHEMSSPLVGNPRVGVSASCPVTIGITWLNLVKEQYSGSLTLPVCGPISLWRQNLPLGEFL